MTGQTKERRKAMQRTRSSTKPSPYKPRFSRVAPPPSTLPVHQY